MRNVVRTTCLYNVQTPKDIKEEIEEVEVEARISRQCTLNDEVRKEFEALLPHSGYPRGRVALYMKSLDIAWHQKFPMKNVLLERGEAHQAILLQLDEITKHVQQIASHLGISLNSDFEAPASPGVNPAAD